MAAEFEGRTVVVTGAGGALGAKVVETLLKRGARCTATVFGHERSELSFDGDERVRIVEDADLTDESVVEEVYEGAGDVWASAHIAGGFAMGPIEKSGLDAWRKMIEMNATTCYLCCRAAVQAMRAAGEGGRIVNVAAKPALVPSGGMVAYSASKGAVASITQSLAEEVKDDGIWVNAIAPSIMDTPANRKAMPKADHETWPKLSEVAETIVFLASLANRVTRGAIVPVYGRS